MFPVIIIAFIILGVEFIIGIIANGLMIVVNCREWIRSRKLTCCDMILTSLGISRFFLQCVILINHIISALPPGMKGLCDIWRTFYVVWVYLNILSLWFATWLSVFYCVKIANFSQCLFLWLKQRISGLLPKLLLGSLLVSLVTCLPAVNNIHKKYIGNSTNMLSGNTTEQCTYNLSSGLSVLSMLGYSFPFFIFIVPAILLITSLWRHKKRMEKNTSCSRDTIAKAHIRAIKGLISFIFFHICYSALLVLFLSKRFLNSSLYFIWFCVVVVAAYPSGHSVILIMGNPKLKRVAVRALSYSKCRLREEVS
ncbi:taste receptor type 2 member 1-like [Emydura macquarii macquarii]|uniref:taste receptor type 2 member 1-like n=1 Tax=Emydura macquarii macquarii TaxID=1129001 RepID=UPI00352A0994